MADDLMAEYSAKWWMKEIEACEKYLDDKWRLDAKEAVRRYLDERGDSGTSGLDDTGARKYNIFWANVQIIKSALYATPPKPEIKRQHDDAKDDIARTAALILERIINFGLDKDNSDMHDAFDLAVDDLLIPGLGQVWLRYEVETQQVPNPAGGEPGLAIVNEAAPTDYVHWRDFLFSTSRTWGEVWWLGRRCWLKRKAFIKLFGQEKWDKIKEQAASDTSRDSGLPKGFTKGRAEVFEMWCEDTNRVYWVNRHLDEILMEKDDPLKLEAFYPCPKPLMATHTTDKFIPRSDYRMVQDQYEELDTLNSRISILTKALRVVGVYDKNSVELAKMLSGGEFNMIPVDNWAAFSESGGMKGIVEWFPVEVIAGVLEKLTQQRMAVVAQIYELTSISDIMRGASNPRDTLGAQKLKAQYSSVRLQLKQQDVGKFVRAAIQLKCEIICNHWQPETIARVSQIEYTESAAFAQEAIALLKDYKASQYRIEVGEETLSIADYNAERELRVEYLTAVGQFLSQAGQMVTSYPAAMPYMLKMIGWVTAAFKGSSDIESVLDEAMAAASQAPPAGGEQQAPDHSLEVAQINAQTAQGEAQLRAQTEQGKAMAQIQSAERIAMAEIASKEKIALQNNQTKVLVEDMKTGQADKELAQEAIGMALEQERIDTELSHDAEQGEQQRRAAQELQNSKPAPKIGGE